MLHAGRARLIKACAGQLKGPFDTVATTARLGHVVIGEDLSIIRGEKTSAKNIQAYFRSGGVLSWELSLDGRPDPLCPLFTLKFGRSKSVLSSIFNQTKGIQE
jgi:hypothetical protein